MKGFWRNLPVTAKRELLLRLVPVIIAGAALVMSVSVSRAWFARKSNSDDSGMQIAIALDKYELLVERPVSPEYDKETGDPSEPLYPGVSSLKSQLTALHYDFTENSTGEAPLLAFELVNEDVIDGKRSLRPGSYGTLTFYLRPLDGDVNVTFSLRLNGFANVYDEHDDLSIVPVENEAALDYLKGHILFFTGRTPGAVHEDHRYSGLIDNGTFSYDTSEHDAVASGTFEGCYEITLYWEWPLTYTEIRDNTSTVSPAVTKMFPAELETYFNAHKAYFLAKNLNSEDETARNDGYNDADQIIGDYVNYVVVSIGAQ